MSSFFGTTSSSAKSPAPEPASNTPSATESPEPASAAAAANASATPTASSSFFPSLAGAADSASGAVGAAGASANAAASAAANAASSAFATSNSMLTNAGFVLFVVIGFVLLLQVGTNMVSSFVSPSCTQLINGMINGNNELVIPQNPNDKNAKTVTRSQNQKGGVEFTWSVWLFVDNGTLALNTNKFCHIFSKGDHRKDNGGSSTASGNGGAGAGVGTGVGAGVGAVGGGVGTTGLGLLEQLYGATDPSTYMINAPGVYFAPNDNKLVVVMNTYNMVYEHVEIDDVPLNKWFHLLLRCTNREFDVFVNGVVTKSMELDGLPKQNYGDVYVARNGGFSGNVSNLWYYNYALGTKAIFDLVRSGPNTSNPDSAMNAISQTFNPNNILNYLSLRWYLTGSGDGYNPTRL